MAMDPGLWELYESGSPDDEVSVILRLAPGAEPPPNVRVVSRFDDICTARLRRGDIITTRQSPGVVSLKAGDIVTPPTPIFPGESESDEDAEDESSDGVSMEGESLPVRSRRRPGSSSAICDWG
jgi:hypothetical protein